MIDESIIRPFPGDEFYPLSEDDLDPDNPQQMLKVLEVHGEIEDGNGRLGWDITAEDWIGYDCFWSDRLQKWVYSLEKETGK